MSSDFVKNPASALAAVAHLGYARAYGIHLPPLVVKTFVDN
jgi:hypothetical protein